MAATPRLKSLTGSTAGIFVEEETSADSETGHTTETVGFADSETGQIFQDDPFG